MGGEGRAVTLRDPGAPPSEGGGGWRMLLVWPGVAWRRRVGWEREKERKTG